LENLPGAETVFLVEPQHSEINDRLWEQPWDIIFFAGHSETEGDRGRIHINPTESLTVSELWYALRKAVERGLQVAMFNSCDGLGLARQLDDLQIPITIVMRELIPDRVAQEFLKYFLLGFSQGKTFYRAVREARERLQGLESEFPCATWLPVVCQHPFEMPPTWDDLLGESEPARRDALPWWRGLGTVAVASVVVTSLVMGARSLGWLEQWELNAYDHLMRSRPAEEPDDRLLLVTITERDVQAQPAAERGGASLSDRSLERLLQVLQKHEPSAIGLQVFREEEAKSDTLARLMQEYHFLNGCVYGDPNYKEITPSPEAQPGVLSPPEVSTSNLGFTNLVVDSDRTIRRHLFALVSKGSSCDTRNSLGFAVARQYLSNKGIVLKYNQKGQIQNFGNLSFKLLSGDAGGYKDLDARGYQIMLNYRHTKKMQIAPKLTLNQVLNNDFDPHLIRDRIVIIGTTATSFNDHDKITPYSNSYGTMSGLELQAHMVSQIISATLDNRPLIWWWSNPIVIVWVWLWSAIGGLLGWHWQSFLRLGLASGIAVALLYGICWTMFLQGGWIPLVPSFLVLVTTGVSVAFLFSNKSIKKFF
jgi:CHASE2 domain-containing sensor protein